MANKDKKIFYEKLGIYVITIFIRFRRTREVNSIVKVPKRAALLVEKVSLIQPNIGPPIARAPR